MRKIYSLTQFTLLLLPALFYFGCQKAPVNAEAKVVSLTSDWKMQPNNKLSGIDEKSVSENSFDVQSWYKAEVPGTVLGALALNNVIEDPTFGINMQKVDTARFKFNQPWWFRTTFKVSAKELKKNVSLHFNGVCYRADLWVNGKKVADQNTFAGTYRQFSFNVNPYIQEGENTVALKVVPFANGEYSLGFCDWNPLPTDRSMGIYANKTINRFIRTIYYFGLNEQISGTF